MEEEEEDDDEETLGGEERGGGGVGERRGGRVWGRRGRERWRGEEEGNAAEMVIGSPAAERGGAPAVVGRRWGGRAESGGEGGLKVAGMASS